MAGPFKMYGKSPMMKKLIGKQHNLPEHLKQKIKDSPVDMYKTSPAKKLEVYKGDELLGEGDDAVMAGKLAEMKKQEARKKGGPASVSKDATAEEKAMAAEKAAMATKEMTVPITYTGKDAESRIMNATDQAEYDKTGKLVK